MRYLVIVAILAAGMSGASAQAQQARGKIEKPSAWICAMVRSQLYGLYGGDRHKAEQAARERGYTAAQIAAGRLCL